MIQDIITYIIIAIAVIITVSKIFGGLLRRNNISIAKEDTINSQVPFGSGCWECSSKCALYKECKDRF